MSRRRLVCLVFGIVLLRAALLPGAPPNILFIVTDDHRGDAMSCYGNPVLRTPAFDRIAREGARFDAFYVASPLCSPSRAALLSGLYPHQRGNGVLDNNRAPDLPRDTPTLATRLGSLGYVTGFVGKAHIGGDPRRWGFADCPVWLPGGSSSHENPELMVRGRRRVVGNQTINVTFGDAGVKFIERHKDERWFLWFASTAPHTPYLRDAKYTRCRVHSRPPPPLWPPGDRLSNYDWAGYYSTTGVLDDQVGRLLRKLDALGLAGDTLVVVLGDNGMMHGSHGQLGKQIWFEESVRVPALVRWPGRVNAGTVVTSPAVSVDLVPTLLEAAGAPKPDGLPGVSLWPAVTEGKPTRTEVFSEVRKMTRPFKGRLWQMAKAGQWKYVRLEGGSERLYDLGQDPGEKADLAQSPDAAAAEALVDMRARLDRWVVETP